MEPKIIDYYNEYPSIISIIDKLNKETSDLKKENEELKKTILDLFSKYKKELEEYKSINELKMILLQIAYEKKKKKKILFLKFRIKR